MRQIEKTPEFISRLPGLIGGRRALKALVGTYNEVGPPDHDMPPILAGLELTVLEGREFTQTMMRGHRAAPRYDLAVIYAGMSAFERVLTYARGLKREHPDMVLVVLVCDCVTSEKSRRDVLLEMLASGKLDAVLTTPQCGGAWEVRDIIHALTEFWPGPAN